MLLFQWILQRRRHWQSSLIRLLKAILVCIFTGIAALGAALKKDIWVDGECIGETVPKIFFYEEVVGDKEHTISTESEFSPNDLLVKTESGKNYFINQYIKLGAFVGGANLELVDEATGKQAVAQLDMAKKGTCSQ